MHVLWTVILCFVTLVLGYQVPSDIDPSKGTTLMEQLDEDITTMLKQPSKKYAPTLRKCLYIYNFFLIHFKPFVIQKDKRVTRRSLQIFDRTPWFQRLNVSDDLLLKSGWTIWDLADFYQYRLNIEKIWNGYKPLIKNYPFSN